MKLHFLLIFLLISCATTHINGQYVDDKDVENISKCKDKTCVFSAMGSPTFVSVSEPNTWYYVSRTLKTIPLSKPRLHEQRIAKVVFDERNNLIDVQSKVDDLKDNVISEKTTTFTHGKKETAIEHFVKNFGKFNKKREKKR
jgi:outer membrane protein assembly factor BamE (lipoprotein component of BamABCDE complex)